MVVLDAKNSRMRDFFNVHALATRETFDGAQLLTAIIATFTRRGTPIPQERPLAPTTEFAAIDGKDLHWKGSVRRLPGTVVPPDLRAVVEGVAVFAGPVLEGCTRGDAFGQTWLPAGAWR